MHSTEPVFRIPDTFQAFPDQNGARSQAYLPAAFEPYERHKIPILLFSFSDIKKDSIIHFYGCFGEGLLNAISKSLFC
jgi:hypothetical protein